MTSMIELGAEAMRAKRRELIAQPLDRIWPHLMRAAIEAMREPSKAALDAGFHKADEYGFLSNDADVADVFRAILDEALQEEKNP